MKVIIAGSRDFTDYERLKQHMFLLLKDAWGPVEIVSGTARGTDKMGERYAEENNIPVKKFPADWEKFGKRAGFRRNWEMAQYADFLVAFWDGQSKGTKHMMDVWAKTGKPFNVIRVDQSINGEKIE